MSAASTTLNAKAIALLVAIAVIGAAGVGGAIAGVGPTGGFGNPFASQEDPAPAPETDVSLEASASTIQVGETTTYDVVVANASGGVGTTTAVVSVTDPDVASISDVSLHGNQSDGDAAASIATDGSSVNLTAASTEAADSGSVAVATVTVSGDASGTSSIDLRVDNLTTKAGDPYTVTATNGASLAIEPKPDPAAFMVSGLNASHTITPGEPFNVSVSVTNDGDLEATRTVRYELDLDGNGTLESDEMVASQAVTLAPHNRETITFSGVNVSDVDPGSRTHGAFTETDSVTGIIDVKSTAEQSHAPETAVRLQPSEESTQTGYLGNAVERVDAGETTTYDVVVTNASGGVGALDFHVDMTDPTHATIRDTTVSGDAPEATVDVTSIKDGQAVNVTSALMDTDENGSVVVATLTIRGHVVGTTDIELSVNTLGTENGTAYNVTAMNGSSITVESDYSGSVDDTDESDADESDGPALTRDDITRAKYSVDFEDLGSETAGEVQAIYNRQPFSGDLDPADVKTRDEISEARFNVSFSELNREQTIEVQNEYDAQFGELPTDPAYTLDDISQAKYDTAFADLNAEQTGEALAIYNRQPFPDDVIPGEIRTRDEITNVRWGQDFIDLSWGTTVDIQNDYDAQFGDGEDE